MAAVCLSANFGKIYLVINLLKTYVGKYNALVKRRGSVRMSNQVIVNINTITDYFSLMDVDKLSNYTIGEVILTYLCWIAYNCYCCALCSDLFASS